MTKETAIKVQDLTKTFKIPIEAHSGLKQKMINTLKGRKGYREFTPLKNISFEIEKGDFYGIVGRNGSGKSTLLKSLAGIYTPNNGIVQINGTLVPFIELGVGFNPELSGRENVFLNGALLGFGRKQMEEMYDKIVDFAELHDFMEEKLKNYSSGMQVRLAFSIAIRADADILLLDEVLAVGDEAFQRKCNDYFSRLKKNRKTVILVTHSMDAVQKYCNKALFLDEGQVVFSGNPREVADLYTKQNDIIYANSVTHDVTQDHTSEVIEKKAKYTMKLNAEKKTKDGTARLRQGDMAELDIEWPYKDVRHVGVAFVDELGKDIFSPATFTDGQPDIQGNKLRYRVKLNVSPGTYTFRSVLAGEGGLGIIDRDTTGVALIVERNSKYARYVGVTYLEHEWKA